MCGIFGIEGHDDAANHVYLGLYALQHRGQESTGIVAWNGEKMAIERGMGYVADVFPASTIERLPGRRSIGHTRYSTAGSSVVENAQPILVKTSMGALGIVHNGNLTNGLDPAPEARAGRLDLPDHQRHRGHPAPDGAQPARRRGRVADAGARARSRGPTRCW